MGVWGCCTPKSLPLGLRTTLSTFSKFSGSRCRFVSIISWAIHLFDSFLGQKHPKQARWPAKLCQLQDNGCLQQLARKVGDVWTI